MSRGFTLVETIMVLILLAIAGAGIASMQGSILRGQSSVKDLQIGTRLMQECAEQLLAVRRFTIDGYVAITTSNFGSNTCGGVTALSGYTLPSVTFTDPYTGADCPTGRPCKLASITQQGLPQLTLLLVDY